MLILDDKNKNFDSEKCRLSYSKKTEKIVKKSYVSVDIFLLYKSNRTSERETFFQVNLLQFLNEPTPRCTQNTKTMANFKQ